MSKEKISFAVENIEEIEENPNSNFATMRVDFFADGDNAHKLFVSEETLDKTARTIYNVPVVWKYDEKNDDSSSHEIDEYAAGFVPDGSKITKKRVGSRNFLSVTALIWKRYSGRLVDIFRRDRSKSVSVEMSVNEMIEDSFGNKELRDFTYLAITVLGAGIQPAISGANMTALSFSEKDRKEYEKDLELEFGYNKYSELDFKIPSSIKESVSKGMKKYKKTGRGGNTLILSIANHISKKEMAEPNKVKRMFKKLSSYTDFENEEDVTKFELCGGKEGLEWSKDLFEKMQEIDKRKSSYFAEESNPFKNIEKEGKEEENMAKEKEEKPIEEEKVEPVAEEPKEEKMAEEEVVPEEKEEVKEEMSAEEEKPVEKMSLNSYVDMVYLMKLLEEVTEDEKSYIGEPDEEFSMACKMAADELKKEEGEKEFGVVAKGMFAKMKRFESLISKMSESQKAYMAENEELKKFKKSIEEQRFSYEVEITLKEVGEVMPQDEVEKSREESKNFSLENVDTWKNSVKAKAFTFASTSKDKKDKKPELQKWAFNIDVTQNKESLWKIN